MINPSCIKTGIFWFEYVSTMAADALAPCIVGTPAAPGHQLPWYVLNMFDKQFHFFQKKGFQLENKNNFVCPKQIQFDKGYSWTYWISWKEH